MSYGRAYGRRWSAGTTSAPALTLGRVVSTRRTKKTLRPELVLCRGPLAVGVAGSTLQAALGSRWALAWIAAHGPQFFKLTPQGWTLQDAGLAAPTLPGGAGHLGFCFDQAGYPVTAWAQGAAVRVRQFDTSARRYAEAGPYPGVDPLLIWDAGLLGGVPGSDVVLWYLSPDRLRVCFRLQRELYGTEHVAATLSGPAVLDQVLSVARRVQLLGEDLVSGQPLALLTDDYPITYSSSAAATLSGPTGGALVPVIVMASTSPDSVAATLSGPTAGSLVPVIATASTSPDNVAATLSGPTGGALVSSTLTSAVTPDAAAATLSGPSSGSLIYVLNTPALTPDAVAATLSSPASGSYTPA